MEKTVSYKVQHRSEAETEVRRFCLDEDCSSSFIYLEQKLCQVFPQLKRQPFSIQWTDEEGDIITVANDEDLMIALSDMKGNLFKFVVKTAKTVKKDENKSTKSDSIHYGVNCDGCQGQVAGFRYKCLVCEDFDLCGTCERNGHHSEHNMIRISNPQLIWPQQVFSPLRIFDQYKKISDEEEKKRKNNPEGNKNMHGNTIPPSASEDVPSIETLLGPSFEMMVNVFAGYQNGKKESDVETRKTNDDSQNKKAIEGFESVMGKSIIGNAENIENMGKVVSSLLQPLGVRVQMKIKNETKEDKNLEKEQGKMYPEKEQNGPENKKVEKSVEPEKEKLLEYQSPPLSDDGDWNVVENIAEKPKAKDQELPKVLYGSEDGTIHPTLPENDTSDDNHPEEIASIPSTSSAFKESTPTPSVIAEHSNPKVRVALQAMLNMGFTNDGGWLTSLLEEKQGNISKTLDVLQPTRN